MREILESCVRVEQLAEAAYSDMRKRCTDPAVAELFGEMSAEEAVHAQWWTEMLEAWDEGRLADVWTATEAARQQIAHTIGEIERLNLGEGPLDAENALTIAARIEFFALDPVFTELLDLSEPGVARSRHEAYAGHVARLVEALDRTFSPDSLAGFLSRILKRAEYGNQTMSEYSMLDSLTGLGNRRALAAQAGQWASWAARYGSAVTFLLVDVDRFKTINEAWGHGVGDRVLVALAGALRKALRSADLVARYGGDEFAVLAPELEPDDARIVAQRIVRAARELKVEAGDGAYVSLTVSVGIATVFDPPDSAPRPLDVLLAAAGRSLHSAKEEGRDRFADPVLLLQAKPLGA